MLRTKPPRKTAAVTALEEVIDETRLLFHRLKVAAEQLHHEAGISAGQRGVLQTLHRLGPRTVPEIARTRPVSRQHIQSLVNPLAADGYVETIDNPSHKRSKRIRLTREGERLLAAIDRREAEVLGALRIDLSANSLREAADVLRAVRERFTGTAWQRALERRRRPARGRARRQR